MQSNTVRSLMPAFLILLIAMLACNLPIELATSAPPPSPTPGTSVQIPVAGQPTEAPPTDIPATATVVVTHTMTPTDPRGGKLVYDVGSAGTAPEKRAPYGDSYDINRLERPFLQDMTYVSDLDIVSFTVAKDNDWWYVSLKLIGIDPNNAMGVNYGVELDLDRGGFGDYAGLCRSLSDRGGWFTSEGKRELPAQGAFPGGQHLPGCIWLRAHSF